MTSSIYVDRLSPFLLQAHILGHPIDIRWYGLSYGLGFLLTFFYFRSAARRGTVPGFDGAALEMLTGLVPLGVVLGGRLGFVVQHPHELLRDPLFALRLWEGGMAFFGGLLGCLLALAWVGRKYGCRFLALTDVAVFPAALGLAFGRLANFANGELIGRPTHAHWGVIFPDTDFQPRYPSQLFESASHLLLFGILLAVSRRCSGWVEGRAGRLSFLFLTVYGFFRFLTDFYRDDDTYWGPFSDGQWISLLTGLVGLILLMGVRKNLTPRPLLPQGKGAES